MRTFYGLKDFKSGIGKTITELEQIPLDKIICFDVETTGLDCWLDEILQVSIIRGDGEVLFNEYIKPTHTNEWEEAQAIHGISPKMVQEKKTICEYKETLQAFFNGAELLVSYNGINFDLGFLEVAGIKPKDMQLHFDVMLAFAPIWGRWNSHYESFKWQKLTTCATYFDYQGNGNYHDSLEDVRATLHCFFKMRSLIGGYQNNFPFYLQDKVDEAMLTWRREGARCL